MSGSRETPIARLALWVLGFILAAAQFAVAERLPVRSYSTADGLPVDTIKRIKRDSHGFLWFCTRDGLSRFDGYQFTNYQREQGLTHPMVNDLIESTTGTYWVATNGGGVCRFNPAERAPNNSIELFKRYLLEYRLGSNIVNRLCEDDDGRIWAGTDQGLFYFEKTKDQFIAAIPEANEIYSMLADGQGGLWIGAGNQLWRRSRDGRVVKYSFQVGRNPGRLFALLEDDTGKLWAGSWYSGLFEIDPRLLPLEDSTLRLGRSSALVNHFTTAGEAVIGTVQGLHQSSDKHIWAVAMPDHSTSQGGGLFEFDGQRFRHYGKAQGLNSDQLVSLAEDYKGNLWLGGVDGAMKVVRNGFTTFDKADGLQNAPNAIFESKTGELCVISERGMAVNHYSDRKFISTRLNVKKALENSKFWGGHQITFQDHAGDWWGPTTQGLIRFTNTATIEQLARARPKAHYLIEGDGNRIDIFRMFEDSRHDIWVSLASNPKHVLVKWERATETFHYYGEADGVPSFNPPTAFCEDGHGNLWIGLYSGGLLRYRAGRFTIFDTSDGLPSGSVSYLHLDQRQNLWIASSSDGAARTNDTYSERPTFARYTIADGLSSNVVLAIAEDEWGRIYFSTPRSVDRLNPETRSVKHYTTADGLPKGGSSGSFRDSHGALWFAGFHEVVRLVSERDEQETPPPVLITAVRVNDDLQPIADLGETAMGGLELATDQNHLQIEFAGLAFGIGEALQYQYKLEGADVDWRPLTALRSVNYANLAPGEYRFLVRSMNPEGRFSPTAASVEFIIRSPIYQRWWFLTLAALAIASAVYAVYRYRIFQLLKVERMRTRIASDLHDDIGSSLSQISIISEVVRAQLSSDNSSFTGPLSTIAQTSRELVDSMSDIVWAINPKRDTLHDLVYRMRHFAMDTLTVQDLDFDAVSPDSLPETRIDTDMRREIFLIYKEAVNNAIRHSGGSYIRARLAFDDSILRLTVEDNGIGFDFTDEHCGHGLFSMRQRAARIGGELGITSTPANGTVVALQAPVRTRRRSLF